MSLLTLFSGSNFNKYSNKACKRRWGADFPYNVGHLYEYPIIFKASVFDSATNAEAIAVEYARANLTNAGV